MHFVPWWPLTIFLCRLQELHLCTSDNQRSGHPHVTWNNQYPHPEKQVEIDNIPKFLRKSWCCVLQIWLDREGSEHKQRNSFGSRSQLLPLCRLSFSCHAGGKRYNFGLCPCLPFISILLTRERMEAIKHKQSTYRTRSEWLLGPVL